MVTLGHTKKNFVSRQSRIAKVVRFFPIQAAFLVGTEQVYCCAAHTARLDSQVWPALWRGRKGGALPSEVMRALTREGNLVLYGFTMTFMPYRVCNPELPQRKTDMITPQNTKRYVL